MFNPNMLTLAREAAGFTQVAFAPKVGISQAFISQVEHGFKTPTDELIERFCVELERPRSFFEDDSRILGDGLVEFFHKKRLTLPAKPLRTAHALVNVTRLEVDRLLRGVDLVHNQPLPHLPVDEHGTPQRSAEVLRALWRAQNGPLLNLVSFVESMGVPVLATNLGHRKLSAISVPLDSGSHLIVVNSMLAASDQRFAVAHELAHLTMHGSMTDVTDLEKEADDFAGTLLMPAGDISAELRRLEFRNLGGLKSRWRVPMKALVYRAKQLGSIDADRATGLFKQLSALPGGPLREPGEFEPEPPRLVRAVIDHMRSELGYTIGQLAVIMKTSEPRLRSFYLGEQVAPHLRVVAIDRPRIVLA
jgi:Zn-dependent peptidase ImmA (M78 family)/transcriptional regulator with XRE-family HTH domain